MEKRIEEINADLQKKLSIENEKYYGNLIVYVRTKAIIRDTEKAENLLLEILQDILEAQNKGISAEDYFGKNPKQIADEIIKNLPINLLDTLKLGLIALISYLIFTFLPAMLTPEKGIDVGTIIIGGLFISLISLMILWLFGITLYSSHAKFNKVLLIAFTSCGFLGAFSILSFVSTPWVIKIGNTTGIILILLIAALLTYLFYQEKDKKIWLPFIPILSCMAVGGILLRIEYFSKIINTDAGKITLAVVLIIATILQYLILFLSFKRKK